MDIVARPTAQESLTNTEKNSMFFCVVFVVMVVVWWICLFCSFYPVFYKRKDMKLSEEEDGDGPGELQREERV